jgi:hypothetical protein
MPFHVEIGGAMRHARVFNLNREDLAAEIVGPWLEDRPIEMGDREWQPSESRLTILDGPQMESPDLAFGQGWSNASRASEDVTRETLDGAPKPHSPQAILVEAADAETSVADLLAGHRGQETPWSEARERLDGRDPEIAAVILVRRKPARSDSDQRS